ncbi:MAG: GatB/YqeY domain-containing protein [Gammaproteobacteria bacterium]|nr:GatB/YqeY domain-containing protein [Gammaproteobacteria bacterium]
MSDLRDRIEAATKNAMRARDRERVAALRLVNAELKQAEIDGRKTLADADVVGVLARMQKQRRDSLGQFEAAGREDLAAIERFEIEVIEEFLPRAMAADEIEKAVAAAIEATGAVGMKDMGRVMGALKGELTGRADMGTVSQVVRAALQG